MEVIRIKTQFSEKPDDNKEWIELFPQPSGNIHVLVTAFHKERPTLTAEDIVVHMTRYENRFGALINLTLGNKIRITLERNANYKGRFFSKHIDWWNHIHLIPRKTWKCMSYEHLLHYEAPNGNNLLEIILFGRKYLLDIIDPGTLEQAFSKAKNPLIALAITNLPPEKRKLLPKTGNIKKDNEKIRYESIHLKKPKWENLTPAEKTSRLQGIHPETLHEIIREIDNYPNIKDSAGHLHDILALSNYSDTVVTAVFKEASETILELLQKRRKYQHPILALQIQNDWTLKSWGNKNIYYLEQPKNREILDTFANLHGKKGWNALSKKIRETLFIYNWIPETWRTPQTTVSLVKQASESESSVLFRHMSQKPMQDWVMRNILSENPSYANPTKNRRIQKIKENAIKQVASRL